jgi:hypothetical protein
MIDDGPDLLSQAHEQAKGNSSADVAPGKTFCPDNHEGRGADQLRDEHPVEAGVHITFRSPELLGGFVLRSEPNAVDEKIGREDDHKSNHDGEEEAFHVHRRKLPSA